MNLVSIAFAILMNAASIVPTPMGVASEPILPTEPTQPTEVSELIAWYPTSRCVTPVTWCWMPLMVPAGTPCQCFAPPSWGYAQ